MSESHSAPVALEPVPKETAAIEKPATAAASASAPAPASASASASTPPPQLDEQPEVAQSHAPATPPEQTPLTPPVEADHHDIEADDHPDDDSSYGDEIASLTTSLNSTITNYKYENGRRYHAQDDDRYFLPNDEKENDRLDLFHHLLTLRCGDNLHLAPISPNVQRILDLGTGTGIWAIEMGDAYPSAEILGNDLSPIQSNLVPPNVRFEVDDMEDTWCFSQQFDYIHCRYLAGAIKDWPRLIAQAFKFTKPGGFVEFQDFDMRFYSNDGTFQQTSSPAVWGKAIVDSLESLGREAEPGPKLKQWIEDAGFENINHTLLPIPLGPWPRDRRLKEIGACDLSMFLEGLEGISLRALINGLNWTAEEVLAFLVTVRKDLSNRRMHAVHNFHVVWAQKPLDPET